MNANDVKMTDLQASSFCDNITSDVNTSIPIPSDDKQLLLSISLADLDPTSKHISDWKEEKSIAAIVAGSEETVRYSFLLGACTAPMVWLAAFSGFRSICVLTVIGSLFDSNSFLSTGCVFI